MNRLSISTSAAMDISSPLLIASYTADDERELIFQIYASSLSGSGMYQACVTKQLLGAGTAFQSPTSTAYLSASTTSVFLPSIGVPVMNTDVCKVYLQGLTTDTAVSTTVEVWDNAQNATLVGSGAISTTLTFNDGVNPLDGVEVWITTDSAGTNVIAGTSSTNASGQVTFMLDSGSYFVWSQLAGYSFTNPQALTVS